MSTKKTTLARIGHALYLALIVLFLYLPIGTLMVLSFNDSKSMGAGILPEMVSGNVPE